MYAALMNLSGQYAIATSDVQRTMYIAAATGIDAALESGLLAVYAILVPAISTLVISFAMLKGVFNKATAYLGLVTGILAIVGVVGPYFVNALSYIVPLMSALSMVWFLLVGYRLYRLGQE